MRNPWSRLAFLLLAPMALASVASGATTIQTQGGIRLVAVTSSVSGALLVLEDHRGHEVARGTTDRFGSLIFRELDPGRGYVVRDDASGDTVPVTVLAFKDRPDQSFYAQQTLHEGLNYIRARDGTLLAAMVRPPLGGSLASGQFPTLVEYSGYAVADPDNPQPSSLIASALGYATVGVNMRGSGCSGGVFDLFDLPTTADGYDIIETVAAQPWVQNGKVGMIGISFPGISQLYVGGAQPPHLEAIAPLSVIADIYRAPGFPGGIFNNGFAQTWLQERKDDAAPAPEGEGALRGDLLLPALFQRLPSEVVDRPRRHDRDQAERGEGHDAQPVEEARRLHGERALQQVVLVDLERHFDAVVLPVVQQLRLPLDDVLEMDEIADHVERALHVSRRRGGPVGSGSADGDLRELRQGFLLHLGMPDGVDGNAALSRLGNHGFDVRGAAVVPSVGDEDDGSRSRERRALRVVAGKGRDRAHQPVVEEKAARVEGDRPALACHVGLVEREGRDHLRGVAVRDAPGGIPGTERADEPARRLPELRGERGHRSRSLQDEDHGRSFAGGVERLRLEDLRAGAMSCFVDAKQVGPHRGHRAAGRGHERQIGPGARPARAIHLHAVEEEARRSGEGRAGQQREGERDPRNHPGGASRRSRAAPRAVSAHSAR